MPVKPPVGCANFPHELAYQSESLLRDRFPNLIQFNHLSRGGHFAAFEEPELLSSDVWAFVEKVENMMKEVEAERLSKAKEDSKKNKKKSV